MNYDEINENILGMLHYLKERPGMHFGEKAPSYKTYDTYLSGVLYGLQLCHGHYLYLSGKMILWFTQKRGENNYFQGVSSQIEHIYQDKTEEERIKILLDTVADFFRENPDWYLEQESEKFLSFFNKEILE